MYFHISLGGAALKKKRKSLSYTFKFMSFLCFLVALALMVLLRVFQTEQFLTWYSRYTETLNAFEIWIETYGATWVAALVILLNYVMKSLIPWFPVSCICVASAVIFKWYWALILNLFGLSILFTIKFYWGRKFGGGNAEKILEKYDSAHRLIDESKLGSGVVLFFTRLIPAVPINSVSCIYGTTDMGIGEFLLVSILGSIYKVASYIIIGRNVFDPASASFIMPFIPLLIISGMVLLSLSGAVSIVKKRTTERLK